MSGLVIISHLTFGQICNFFKQKQYKTQEKKIIQDASSLGMGRAKNSSGWVGLGLQFFSPFGLAISRIGLNSGHENVHSGLSQARKKYIFVCV